MAQKKCVTIRGTTYESYMAAASALGVSLSAIQSAVKRGSLDTVGSFCGGPNRGLPIKIDKVTYRSVQEAHDKTKISITTLYQIAHDQKYDREMAEKRSKKLAG